MFYFLLNLKELQNPLFKEQYYPPDKWGISPKKAGHITRDIGPTK